MNRAMIAAIEQLRGLTVAALRTKYQEVFGEESNSSHKQFLFRRIAWRMQANAEGGLSERARRRAAEIADEADLRIRAPKSFSTESPSGGEWSDGSQRQRDCRLKVLGDGFEYESRRYRSLSAIAREVTGTRWNGLLFFGLAERRDA